jgi:hypothetical protein
MVPIFETSSRCGGEVNFRRILEVKLAFWNTGAGAGGRGHMTTSVDHLDDRRVSHCSIRKDFRVETMSHKCCEPLKWLE